MWEQHAKICVALLVLAIPFYLLDTFLLQGGGSGWISLDLRGLIIIPYIAFALTHIAVSSLARYQFPGAGLLPLHLASGLIAIGLLVTGFLAYGSYERAKDAAAYNKRTEVVTQLRKVIELRNWWYVPDAEAPTSIHASVIVHESGRFAGNAEGRTSTDSGEMIFHTMDTTQRQTDKDDEFTYILPLHLLKEGKADKVSITLYLFKDQTGTAPEDITIIFEDNPSTDYDGHFIYAPLPPRIARQTNQ